mmetsp:Transcript_29802/g.65123  ORF Transcript_29802/g.65123 Transcript_29802/m.65123 type:complete len:299 (+) Transcript_29802:234-1130(+)|eukprot:CAMPEP_0118943118 /NCGR_PEP_ID=MMETSP1169-20130426/37564_1 /TAXON_ID=36882 /ORGANISM="Pyramimonas obovata, Strain CCMP722" /LENGTH=298 /DNA_ID=CAMNT_0006888285 /DNA_START=178 /DNA_END=1074 /DNA_ORIENTATION=+
MATNCQSDFTVQASYQGRNARKAKGGNKEFVTAHTPTHYNIISGEGHKVEKPETSCIYKDLAARKTHKPRTGNFVLWDPTYPSTYLANREVHHKYTPINFPINKVIEDTSVDLSSEGTARKSEVLKRHFPTLDARAVFERSPKVLEKTEQELDECAKKVKHMLSEADDIASIIQAEPDLLEPTVLASVLSTFQRWFPRGAKGIKPGVPNKNNPVAILERDPDLIRRSREKGIPFDPVFDGKTFKALYYNTEGKLVPWQFQPEFDAKAFSPIYYDSKGNLLPWKLLPGEVVYVRTGNLG